MQCSQSSLTHFTYTTLFRSRFLNVTQDETERMIRLVNDLLQLSRMDQKEYTLQRERTEFVSYFREVVERFEINVTSEIQFEYKMPQRKMFVWIDRDKMTQVLDNIISNAIKYSPEGGKIRLSIERKNRQLYVQIQDEGIGIPEEMHEKIFERFYRADKARTRKLGGSGLGLAISKEIVGFMMIGEEDIIENDLGVFETNYGLFGIYQRLSEKNHFNKIEDEYSLLLFLQKQRDNPKIKKILDEVIDNWAKATINMVSIIDPQAIILAGELEQMDQSSFKQYVKRIEKFVPKKPEIRVTKLGSKAGIYGAFHLGLEHFHMKGFKHVD